MVRTSKNISFPQWMLEDIKKSKDSNVSERVRQLIQKGLMVETLENATGQTFQDLVKQPTEKEKGTGPTGHRIHSLESPLRFSSLFGKTNPRTVVSSTSEKLTA